jgi:nucleotide-binding universal stress UspA family protein
MVAKIAVGIDGSPTASKALDMAVEMARSFGAELVLLSVYDGAAASESGEDELSWATNPAARVQHSVELARDTLSRSGLNVSLLSDQGDAGDVLVRLAEECSADVLVVGNKGMHRRVLGSVPNTVAHNAPCSVLVVKTT